MARLYLLFGSAHETLKAAARCRRPGCSVTKPRPDESTEWVQEANIPVLNVPYKR